MRAGQVLDLGDACQMSEVVLRNSLVPANNFVENWRRSDVHRKLQLAANRFEDALIVPGANVPSVPAAGDGAEQNQAGGGAVGVNRGAPLDAKDVALRSLGRDKSETDEVHGHVGAAISE